MTQWSAMPGAGYFCPWFSLGQAEPSCWPSPASCLPLPGEACSAGLLLPAFPQLPQERSGSYMSVRCRRVDSSLGTAVSWFPSRYLREKQSDTGSGHHTPSFLQRRHLALTSRLVGPWFTLS